MTADPLILYVPGLKPKPEPAVHRRELLRCLAAGVQRLDPGIAEQLQSNDRLFDLVSWTYDFYGEHRDIDLDLAAIDAVIEQPAASERDRAEAGSSKLRLLRSIYRAGDYLPFLIPHFADENIEIQLRDLRRYARNEYDIADSVRRLAKLPLRAAAKSGRPILLIGHSMGSVIAYDVLWQLCQQSAENVSVDLFLTMGSPLGQRYIQSRLLQFSEEGERHYPSNISRWENIAAVGELTALDTALANDFGDMLAEGTLRTLRDHQAYNYFRIEGELNVHAEYGYLVNEVSAGIVCDWLRSFQVGFDDDVDAPVLGTT